MADVINWSCDDVNTWLVDKNFAQYADLFTRLHKVDGPALLCLNEADLRQPPLQLEVLGDIKHLSVAIRKLQEQSPDYSPRYFDYTDSIQSQNDNIMSRSSPRLSQRHGSPQRRHFRDSNTSLDSVSDDGEIMEVEVEKLINRCGRYSKALQPEIFKTVLSFIYVFAVFLLTSFVMVVVHDRVPDMQKYPPLPDLFLDNMPHISWAFQMGEAVGVALFCIWTVILFFHKHRFILMRRMFSMLGTVFLLRCVTMLITSLSVPGQHLECQQKMHGSWYEKLSRTYEIWSGAGMSIQGVSTCGDYMFSGHTSCITLLNFFITEYSPQKMYYIHTVTWVANLFGVFFILAAHEHYSIDVFIAFYITSRLFLYYHTLANNRSLMMRDKKRRRIWFPLFSYFESKCNGIVPNEYEWPFPYPKSWVAHYEKRRKKYF